MEIRELYLHKQSKLLDAYFHDKDFQRKFFDYPYRNGYIERLQELTERSFQRQALVEYLLHFNRKYGCSDQTVTNIEKLLEENAVVVVGGQQAGVLTGPLYTIHKIISIIKLAKKQEEALNVPVIPLFWIAGEDHDFEEINHIYNVSEGNVRKRKIDQLNIGKKSVSQLSLNKQAVKQFLNELFLDGKETLFTKNLYDELVELLSISESYLDFFSFFVQRLFSETGIVLLDSHSQQIRELEMPFFKELVEHNEALNESFQKGANELFADGFGEPIERGEHNAHLFYHFNGARQLLERSSEDGYSDKQKLLSLTKQELLQKIEAEPENFSNNVVTRPLMQEYLLPVLAFVAGPGEIAYWATLKNVFHFFNFKVPPVVPRLSMTIVEPHLNKWLQRENVSAATVVSEKKLAAKEAAAFVDDKKQIDAAFAKALDEFTKLHLPLKELAVHYDKGLERLALKNEHMIKDQLAFLATSIEKCVRQKYQFELARFDEIEANLVPNGGLQERSLNIVMYLNIFGPDFVSKLTELEFSFDHSHKLIYLN